MLCPKGNLSFTWTIFLSNIYTSGILEKRNYLENYITKEGGGIQKVSKKIEYFGEYFCKYIMLTGIYLKRPFLRLPPKASYGTIKTGIPCA